jgi:hypothetical protein
MDQITVPSGFTNPRKRYLPYAPSHGFPRVRPRRLSPSAKAWMPRRFRKPALQFALKLRPSPIQTWPVRWDYALASGVGDRVPLRTTASFDRGEESFGRAALLF